MSDEQTFQDHWLSTLFSEVHDSDGELEDLRQLVDDWREWCRRTGMKNKSAEEMAAEELEGLFFQSEKTTEEMGLEISACTADAIEQGILEVLSDGEDGQWFLFIDDTRPAPSREWTAARSLEEVKELLDEHGKPDAISFDYHMGSGCPNGAAIARYVKEEGMLPDTDHHRAIQIHTDSFEGRREIHSIVQQEENAS